ncbi:MAG: response regulator transcription factor [Saprospiraceae bacterium]|nr:response regulator transcription factor [Saprospiraceae bacterium]
MIKYLIIDDEHMAHKIIKDYCDHLSNMQLMKHCYDAFEALDYLRGHQVDLIFLDLNMPKLKGFDFLKTLPDPPKVIVTTAYQEYALEGYELEVTDYLLKPFSFERFLKAVNKAIHIKDKISSAPQQAEISNPGKIFLYSDKKHIQVKMDDIYYVEAAGNYSRVVLRDNTIMVREKISDMLNKLSSDYFIKVHKSFIVAREHITSIEGNRILIGEHKIPIGKMYKNNVLELLKGN